jgi:branched-chain amino acid transport system substrate-binding protein
VIVALPTVAISELHVGFIGGFSGPGKAFGDAARNGFELAREELGSKGIQVTYEDDQFDPKKTVNAFNKLVHHDKVDVIIVLGSTPSAAIAPLAEKQGIPTISWASAKHIAKGRQWVVRSWASGSDEGSALASKARELELKRVGTLAYSDEYAASVVQGFEAGFGSGSTSLGEVSAAENAFSPFILQAKSKRLEAIMLCLSVGQGAQFARQMKQLNFKAMLLGCETFNSSTEIELSQGALTGTWFATVPVSETFRARYLAKFNSDTSVGGSAVHYELYRLLADVAASSPSRDQIRQHLLSVRERESVVGTFSIVARDNDQALDLPIVVKQIP